MEGRIQDAPLHKKGRSYYLVGDEFSATDIIVGWTVNWARNGGKVSFEEFPSLSAYLGRLFAREHCTLSPPD